MSGGAAAQTSANQPAEPSTGLSGYMDFHVNKPEHEDATIDFHRFVLLVTHRFSDRIRFVGELELEHAFVEGLEQGGELELEQAYVDFLISRQLNVRAGMLLMPIGIINERHEPPVFYGVERPFVDTFIVPTTWFEAGAGVHGEIGRGWRYRTFVAAPLNAREFSAEEGLREGRTASRALGYAQILRVLDGELTEEAAMDDTVRSTRRFARRQDSWFRRDKRTRWLTYDSGDLLAQALTLI